MEQPKLTERPPLECEGLYTHARRRHYAPKPSGSCQTEQSARNRTSIREIVKRAQGGAMVTHVNPKQPLYGDLTVPGDLQSMLDTVKAAEEAFYELPSDARKACDNDPVRFLELVDSGDREILEALGLKFTSAEDEKAPHQSPGQTSGRSTTAKPAESAEAPGAAEAKPKPAPGK